MSKHLVRGSTINVVAVVRHLGVKFQLSRPVERNGQRRRSGWMLSYDGHWMALLPDDIEKDAAVAHFKSRLAEAADRGALEQAIEKTISDEKAATCSATSSPRSA